MYLPSFFFDLFLLHFVYLIQVPDSFDGIPVKGYSLYWNDEFSGASLNLKKWKYRNPGIRGDAYNSPETIFLNNKGQLVIEVKEKDNKVLAGMIDTEGCFSSKYGYFESRVKLSKAAGVWPAFWLQSSLNMENGTPEKNGVEIDIFEYFIHNNIDSVTHSLHWGGYGKTHKVFGPFYSALQKTSDGYHVFGLEWTPESYSIFVDGIKMHNGKQYISQVPQFMVLSMEVNEQVVGKLNRKNLPDSFLVDYVRVYKKKN